MIEKNSKTGILLINTGTPDAPSTKAVRAYLREFLSDPYIVKIPRLIWLPILYGLILPFRAKKSAALYQKIWTPQGSPMRHLMKNIAGLLQKKANMLVELGMNYGKPSIQQGIDNLLNQGVEKIIILPLYPQYSTATTASSMDRVNRLIKKKKPLPVISFIDYYYDHAAYIAALASSIQHAWNNQGKAQHLLISFHGVPERFIADGDPYASHCEKTAELLAEALKLNKSEWTLCYQSQFGYDKWLKPSTQDLFNTLAAKGIKTLDVICPGFSVDCLETLEEIAIAGKKSFIESGGESLRYIPALNDSSEHIDALLQIIQQA